MRIEAIRNYLFTILDELLDNKEYQINANFLDKGQYSVDRLPTDTTVEKWVIGTTRYREVYEFRSNKAYSQDVMTNLKNIGFFESFEKEIRVRNKDKDLPIIVGIESIECLNAGALAVANVDEAIFTIQIQIEYVETQEKLSI